MCHSIHCDKRLRQRGITKKMLNLTFEYGNLKGDKVILNKKGISKVMELKRTSLKKDPALKSDLLKIMDKGGLTVVFVNNKIITAYGMNK